MKRTLLTFSAILSLTMSWGQTQIGNSGFENWETVSSDQEPVNWNSFLTAGGSYNWAAANQIQSSADVRPGSAGTASCRIWSRSTFGIIANGNVTTGKINMGSTSPTNSSNYNYSVTADANFSEAITDMPDSIVFWAKFTPNGHTQNARMKATLHDAYDYRDPEDATSTNHVVATAVKNYPSTNGNWTRFSVPFTYAGPASTVAYILVTFTTNETAGGGAADDEVLIDDVELIYNPSSVTENELNEVVAFLSNGGTTLNFKSSENVDFIVYDLAGNLVLSGENVAKADFNLPKGTYLVRSTVNGKITTSKVVKY